MVNVKLKITLFSFSILNAPDFIERIFHIFIAGYSDKNRTKAKKKMQKMNSRLCNALV